MKRTHSKVPPSPCWSCGWTCDRATGILRDAIAAPGDLTVCLRCGALAIFDAKLVIRSMTRAQLREAMTCDQWSALLRAQAVILQRRREKPDLPWERPS